MVCLTSLGEDARLKGSVILVQPPNNTDSELNYPIFALTVRKHLNHHPPNQQAGVLPIQSVQHTCN